VSYIRLTGRGLPPTMPMVRNFAFEMSKIMPGKNWVYKFVQRHNDTLAAGFLQGRI